MKTKKRAACLMAALSMTVMAAATMPNAHALDLLNSGSETQGDMVIFPGSFGALVSDDNQDPNAGAPGSPAGWHLPGRGYRAGAVWWALICDADEQLSDDKKGCKLVSTQLFVTPARHPIYDGKPVNSQLLHWSPLPGNLDQVPQEGEKRPALIAVFKPLRSLANLKLSAGPVRTYVHQGMTQYPGTNRPGTLEVRLSLGNGRYADIVPRVNPIATKDESQDENPMALTDIATFELRMGNQRQRLPGYGFPLIDDTGQLSPQDYLQWAGDLDGDDIPDLLLKHGSDNSVALYLSSLAKEGELVGLAGSFEYSDPSSAGC